MNKFNYILGLSLFVMLLVGMISTSHADYMSPKKQLDSGVLPDDVMCNENKVLVIRDNGKPACVYENTAKKLDWSVIKTVFEIIDDSDFQKLTLSDVFIKSDVKEVDIPTGMFTKWVTENTVRAPAAQELSFLEQLVVKTDRNPVIPASTKESSQNDPLALQAIQEQHLEAQKKYTDYLSYFPSYVPDGMELKGFSFSTYSHISYLKLFYAPIPVDIDFDSMDAYEFADLGGIIIDLTHQHNNYKKGETWEHWQKVYPDGDYGETILHDAENSIFIAYGVNFLSLAMHKHMIIEFETFSFSGEELYKMAETILDAKEP